MKVHTSEVFASSPLVSGVILHLPHSFRVYFQELLVTGCLPHPERLLPCPILHVWRASGPSQEIQCKTTLETSEEDVKLHSKRVEKMKNYTRKNIKGTRLVGFVAVKYFFVNAVCSLNFFSNSFRV